MIREYRKYGKTGLSATKESTINSDGLTRDDLNIIKHDYTSYMPEDRTLYKLSTDKVKDGHLQYMDLSIYHPKYGGKYDDHVPIDLAHFFCTMTQGGFKHAWTAWRYAVKQPMMNKIGPLGKRAGEIHQSLC